MSEANGREDELRDARIGKILSDYADRRAAGEAESEAELLAAYPDLADDLRMHLDMLRNLGSGQARIDALITQGILHRTSDPQYPAQLGPYKITGFIGQGGMGIVLKAYEESLNRTVALKILRPDLAGDQAALARFTREAQAAAALRHPNIVTVHAVGEEHGVHFLAMEFVDGPSLRGFIREAGVGAPSRAQVAAGVSPAEEGNDAGAGWPTSLEVGDRFESTGAGAPSLAQQGAGEGLHSPTFDNAGHPSLPPETIRAILRQLLSGLAAAHDAGLIHRDIKSSNILLDGWPPAVVTGVPPAEVGWPTSLEVGDRFESRDRTPRPEDPCHPSTQHSGLSTQHFVKIADFGLARMLSSRTRMTMTGSVLGTPEYMSPEQARGDTKLDHRTDLYSAGVVLYEMLTGQTPFRADTPSAVIHQILHSDPTDPRTISPDTDPHLASLALRLMAKRPEDRFDHASDALTALDASEQIHSPERRRALRRKTTRWSAIALVAVVLVITGVLWDRLSSRSNDRIENLSHDSASETNLPITAVQVKKDDAQRNTTMILASYGDDPVWRVFHDFPPEAVQASDVVLANLDGSGHQAIVAGIYRPLDGCCLFAFDPAGRQLWALDFSSPWRWPDCASPTKFGSRDLARGNLDGKPGDELIVVADQMDEYPTRLSIVDPRTHEIRSTFWHMGHISQVLVAPHFFGPGKPAIIARGNNNKLDGFNDGLRDDEERFTRWDIVHVLMILDPADMDGLGPPRTSRMPDIPPAQPWAYAFLDLSHGVNEPDVSAGRENPRFPERAEVGNIEEISIEVCPEGEGSNYCIRLAIWGGLDNALMTVNPDLEICRWVTGTQDYWRRLWRPIIQNGKYVNKPRSGEGS